MLSCYTINVSETSLLINTALAGQPGDLVTISSTGFAGTVPGRIARIGAHSTAIIIDSQKLGSEFLNWLMQSPKRPPLLS
jgi:hypothetical protein